MANPNTAVYPGAIASDSTIPVANDAAYSTLSNPGIDNATTDIPFDNTSVYTFPCFIALDNEIVKAAGPASSGVIHNCQRGALATTAAPHSAGVFGYAYIFAYQFNQMAVEIKAIETALGINLGNVLRGGAAAAGDLSGTYPNPTVSQVGGSSASTIADAVAKRHSQNTDTGTNSNTYQVGTGGPKVKNVAADSVELRNSADSDYANLAVKNLTINGASPVGGDLTGNLPNPTLATVATPGTYGDATHIPQITLDAKGRTTSVTPIAITGAAPSGAAGGDLSATYPNPTVAKVGGVVAATIATGVGAANAATDANTASTIVKRDTNGDFSARHITASLFNGPATGAPPTGAAGGDLSGTYPNPSLLVISGVVGIYGSASKTVTVNIDNRGRIIAVNENVLRLVGGGSAPAIAAAAGAGTTPTVAIAGHDNGGKISVTTGTGPGTAASIVDITFATAFAAAPVSIVISPGNAATAALTTAAPFITSIATTGFTLEANAAALTASTAYVWYYTVIG